MTNKSGTLYTGVTNNLVRRVHEHKAKLIPGFTRKYNINKLIFFETFGTPTEAIAAEKRIKGWTRKRKIDLIERENPKWRDLSADW
jgi:putative endonuclease